MKRAVKYLGHQFVNRRENGTYGRKIQAKFGSADSDNRDRSSPSTAVGLVQPTRLATIGLRWLTNGSGSVLPSALAVEPCLAILVVEFSRLPNAEY